MQMSDREALANARVLVQSFLGRQGPRHYSQEEFKEILEDLMRILDFSGEIVAQLIEYEESTKIYTHECSHSKTIQ